MSDIITDEAIIEDLITRGVENIIPDAKQLKEALSSGKKLNVYLGIDPTATRIHIGHAFPLRKLSQLSELGHNVTFLIGDFTAKVGDTSDKDTERPMLTDEQIKQNFEDYKKQAAKLIDFKKVNAVFNSEWLSKLNFGDVLSLTRNFSVNDFVSRELIRKRLDAGTRVSLPEVLYPIMQGYDSYHLDTDIQFGGTDQTFNMQAGRTLVKKLRGKDSFVVANGFLPGTDGRKMSKSWGNAVWMNDSAQEMFGKVMSVSDDAVREYYLYGTNVPIPEIDKRLKDSSNPMETKKQLAREVVSELCSEDEVKDAEEHFVATVQNKEASEDSPRVKVGAKITGSELLELIVKNELASSKSEARRLFEQSSIRVNDKQVSLDDEVELSPGENTVRVGKRRYLILENE